MERGEFNWGMVYFFLILKIRINNLIKSLFYEIGCKG